MSKLNEIMKKLEKLGFDMNEKHENVKALSSGSWLLDTIIGVGGYPRGRLIELFGSEMSGKSYLSLLAIREAQKAGLMCGYIDAEHGFDPRWAQHIGVSLDKNKLLLLTPDYGEQALEGAIALTEVCQLIVIDSTAALVPKSELEGTVEDMSVGTQARMLSKALRMLIGKASDNEASVIFINQLRETISRGMPMFGDSTTTPGGRALKFYASVRLRVEKKQQIKNEETKEIIGHDMLVKIIKNKCGNPYGQVSIPFYYGTGIDEREGILQLAIEREIIKQAGRKYEFGKNSWLSFKEMAKDIDLEQVKVSLKSLLGQKLI